MTLQGRTAVVTGGGRGIGKSIAMALAREGARVVISSRTVAELQDVASCATDDGFDVVPVEADVTDAEDVRRLMAAATADHHAIDILVNNAGVYGQIGPFAESDFDPWWRALEVNLGGTARCTRAVVPGMIERGRGKIINLSGGGATAPLPNLTAYAVSKAAVVRFTETLAQELAPYSIQVNAVAPGAVDTRIQDELLQAGERAGAALYAQIKRMRESGQGGTSPTVAADLVAFLASDASNGLSGKLISAPHDPWRDWTGAVATELTASPMFTLRRLDPFTLRPLRDRI